MNTSRFCPHCGTAMLADSPQGVCPRCVLNVGLGLAAGGGTDPTISSGGAGARFIPPKPAQLAPHFPQLEILDLIGQGGMGAVYKARQLGLDRIVALKILPPEVARDPSFAERFHREARALARLNHPHIVSVYDSGQAGGLYYFIMEYVDGINLRQAIQARSITPQESLAIVPQICDALQYAHDEGIVHRDIKPDNILLDAKGRIKIADFGLARLLGKTADTFTLTAVNQVMGTPKYMAPEQLEGSHEVDHRADIYSLGVVFYEMLTHELPIGRFAPPSKKVQVDVRLDEIVLRTLEKEPSLRYQQASEVKSAVDTIREFEQLPRHMRRMYGYEYRSKLEIFGLPLVHIAYGMHPKTHRRRVAKGIIAIGDVAVGVLAMGGMAIGGLAVGGLALGLVSLGGFSLGILCALGGGAIGLGLSIGGLAVGSVAIGGCAVGIYAMGGAAFGLHAVGGNARDPVAREFFRHGWPMVMRAAMILFAATPFLIVIGWMIGMARTMFRRRARTVDAVGDASKFPVAAHQPTAQGAGFASGCAIILILLMLCGVPLGAALLVGGYVRTHTRSQQSVALAQRAEARMAADQAMLASRRAAEMASSAPNRLSGQSRRHTGLSWTTGEPALSQIVLQRMELGDDVEQRINDVLRTVFLEYVELEQTHRKLQGPAGRKVTKIQLPPEKIYELDHRMWTRLDALLTTDQQAALRSVLRVVPARRESFGRNANAYDVVMPSLLGWGDEEATVEILQKGEWYYWTISSQQLSLEGSGREVPAELRRFMNVVAEQPPD